MVRIQKYIGAGIIGLGVLSTGLCSAAIISYGNDKLTPQEQNFAKNSLYPNTYAVIVQQVYVPAHYKKVYYQNPNVIYYDDDYYAQPVVNVTPGFGLGIGVGWGGYYGNYWRGGYHGWGGHHGGWGGHHGGHHGHH